MPVDLTNQTIERLFHHQVQQLTKETTRKLGSFDQQFSGFAEV